MLASLLVTLLSSVSIAHAAPPSYKQPNVLAGVWNLTSVTETFSNGTVVEPFGPKPYGRLIFTPGLYYTQQSNRGDYAKDAWPGTLDPFTPGTAAENAGVVRNSFAISGTYRVDSKGQYAGLMTSGSIIPNFIGVREGPPTQTFTSVQKGQKLIERLAFEGWPVYEYVWVKVESF